jgi:hypothetical protein
VTNGINQKQRLKSELVATDLFVCSFLFYLFVTVE